jgi:hypothetical protein
MNKALPVLSLLLSVAALATSLVTISRSSHAGPTPEEINKMIAAEIDARERARIAALAPKAKAVYRDMLPPDRFNAESFAPTTYEELFAPLVLVVTGMTTQ